MTAKTPVLFAGHGNPMNAVTDSIYAEGWKKLGGLIPRPKQILAVSAHWFTRGSFVNDSETPKQVYDMYGFPQALYDVKYPAPGSPALARRVQQLLAEVRTDNSWGIDHGTWSVLHRIWPGGGIPVVQLSVDGTASPERMLETGRALRPLRDEGTLIFASGNVVHNLRLVDWETDAGYPWAVSFSNAIRDAIADRRTADVAAWNTIPGAQLAVPTPDHFDPLLYALGAAEDTDRLTVFNDSCELGSMSMTGFLWTPAAV